MNSITQPTIYTLISYTEGSEGWHDRCGDYITGTPSNLDIQYFNDINALADFIGKAKAYNNNDTEFTLLINGIDVNHAINNDDFLTQYCIDFINQEDAKIYDLAENYRTKYTQEKKQKEEKEKLLQLQKDELAKQQRQKQAEQKERAELAKLIAKYGTTN